MSRPHLYVTIDEKLQATLHATAEAHGQTISTVVRRALRRYLAEFAPGRDSSTVKP